jgi:hypothetical protein
VNAHHNRNAEQITGHAPFHQTKRIQIQSEPQSDIGRYYSDIRFSQARVSIVELCRTIDLAGCSSGSS